MNNLRLNKVETSKWRANIVRFFLPLISMYLGQLGFTFQIENHVFSLLDFVPSTFLLGAMIFYIQSIALDYQKKLTAQNQENG